MSASEAIGRHIAQLGERRDLSRADAHALFEAIMTGAATAAQIGGVLMALKVKGETVDEITGAVEAMRALSAQSRGRDDLSRRHLRHRRQRRGEAVQHFHRRGIRCSGGRRTRRKARQSRHDEQERQCRRARSRGRESATVAGSDRPLHSRRRRRLHVRSGAPRGNEARCRRAARTWHTNDLQPGGAVDESGVGAEPGDRGLRAGAARDAGARAETAGEPSRPAGPRGRTG